MGKSRKYSIDDLDELITSIKSGYKLKEEEIASQLGYNEGYISQTRARGFVPDKFMEALKREFAKSNTNGAVVQNKPQHGGKSQNQGIDPAKEIKRLNDRQITIEAKIDVLFDVAVELLSATSGESGTLIRKKLEKRVDELKKFAQ